MRAGWRGERKEDDGDDEDDDDDDDDERLKNGVPSCVRPLSHFFIFVFFLGFLFFLGGSPMERDGGWQVLELATETASASGLLSAGRGVYLR